MVWSETTTLIGLRCTARKSFSREVLITNTNHPNADFSRKKSFASFTLYGKFTPLDSLKAINPEDENGMSYSLDFKKNSIFDGWDLTGLVSTPPNRLGFFCVGVLFQRAPPLPIPNREVKPL